MNPALAAPDPAVLGVFLAATLVLLLTPGPAVFYIVARSLDHGRRAGLVSTLGINAGAVVHVAAAAIGLSALLAVSASLFAAVKIAGAVFLVLLGVRRLRARDEDAGEAAAPAIPDRRIFLEGVVVNVLNPKAALFFFAFLPQFVRAERGTVAAQVLVLGGIFVGMALVTDGLYAVAAGSLGEWMRRRRGFRRAMRRAAGGVFVGLGLATALGAAIRK